MKLFSTVLRRKRGVVFFVAAFMLPLCFVVIVSVDTFSKRQKTTRNLLESNLWFSGRSALDQLEVQFIELETNELSNEYFSQILKNESLKRTDLQPDLFIINQDFQVKFPEVAEEKNQILFTFDKSWNPDYRDYMGRAETAELTEQNFTDAINNYQTCQRLAKTGQQEALSIEGLARSYMAVKNYPEAIRYYQLLKNKYGQTENRSGHPYGISSSLQLYSIGTLIGENVFSRDSLLKTYLKLKNRNWMISSSSYFFFKEEFESILKINNDTTESNFEKTLNFNQFLKDFVIPAIQEKSGFSAFRKPNETKRIYINIKEIKYLVSYKDIPSPDNNKLCFAGIRWNLDSVINQIIKPNLSALSEETGLEFQLVNDTNMNLLTSKTARIPEESLVLKFTKIPFPWTLFAIQPGYEKLESDAKTQMIIYGVLLVLIIVLMFFGAYVLLRDISRETDSLLLQTEFVHNVSHELKTPLSLIRLYGETLLLKEHLPETDRREGLQIITKESERLSYMINNILDFSKIEMGRKEFDMKPGNLAEVVLNTLDSYRYHFIKKGFSIKEKIDLDIPEVLFDKNALEGILINLFSNAVKFSASSKEVVIMLKRISDSICLEVADKGIGISHDELLKIFNRFYRVKNTGDFEARGSGLGLTIVKHAVEAHGWKIEVKSTPGLGSIFSIFIPLNDEKEERK